MIDDFFCPNEPMHRVEKSKVMLNLIIPVVNLGFGNDSKGCFDFVYAIIRLMIRDGNIRKVYRMRL